MIDLIKIKKEALLKGMTLVSKGIKPKHYLYKFNNCNHVKEYIPSKIRNHVPVCKECNLERFKKEALEKGLIFHPVITKPKHYTYEFIGCGHKKEYEPRTVRNKTPTCDECLINRFKKEANEKDLTLIGNSERKGYYLYQFNECKHIKESRPDMINTGYPCCEVCGDTYHSKSSNLYLIKIFKKGHSFLKLGVANSINHRVKTYQLQKGYKAETILSIPFSTNFKAVRVEKLLHKKYSDFNLNHFAIKTIMKSGFTECYPLNLLDQLKKEIQKI